MRSRLLALFLCSIVHGAASAAIDERPACYIIADDPLAGTADTGGALISWDPTTRAESGISVTGALNIEAIAFDPFSENLYAFDESRFGIIDPATGEFIARSELLGSGDGEFGLVAFSDVDGLAVDPFSGRLFGAVKRVDEVDLLIEINPSRGTFVPDAFGSGVDYVRIEPAREMADIDDMAFDPETGILYAIANDFGWDDRLVIIDLDDGDTHDVGRLTRSEGTLVDDIEGISFSLAGQLLGVKGAGARKVYLIDKNTAVANRIAVLESAGDYESIACFMPHDYVRIEGDVFSDRNADTLFDEEEPGVFGVPVYLYRDVNLNGRADSRDPRVAVAETDTDGHYGFRFAAVGPFAVTIDAGVLPDGVSVTTAGSRLVDVLDFGKRYRHQDFGISNMPAVLSVSTGADAGIESEGSMALLLSQRQFARRQDAHLRAALLASPEPVPFDASSDASKSAFMDVGSIIPAEGPASSAAFVVTPADLIGATNAYSVFAADYLRPDGNRVAGLFAAISPMNEPYDHAKVICDRLSGATLEDVRPVAIDDGTFLLSRIAHDDGKTDYAISFIVYRNGNDLIVDSRFTSSEYLFSARTSEILNVQVWSLSPRYTADLVESILDKISEANALTFLNDGKTKPDVPGVWVRDGSYNHGTLTLRVFNRAGLSDVLIKGTIARTEIAAGRKEREPFERRISLTGAAGSTAFVSIPIGAIYDADLSLITGGVGDRIYHADGVWSYARGEGSSISFFETYADPFAGYTEGGYVVERDAYVSGSIGDWAALFRYLKPGGRGVDLSRFGHVEFKAYGHGTIRLVLEKESIDSWDQFGYTFTLQPEEETFRIPVTEFTRTNGSAGFSADDVTLLAFYVERSGYSTQRFDFSIRDLSFGGSPVAAEQDEVPAGFSLQPNYPNPFNPSTRITFSIPRSQHVRLEVFDMLGRRVETLVDGITAGGEHTVSFDAHDLPSAPYLYRLEAGGNVEAKTMVLLK